jgi:hypothetical protein
MSSIKHRLTPVSAAIRTARTIGFSLVMDGGYAGSAARAAERERAYNPEYSRRWRTAKRAKAQEASS